MTQHGLLQRLGWHAVHQAALAQHGDTDLKPARVTSEHRGRYRVWGLDGQHWAWPPQGMRRKVSSLVKPGVGDWVLMRSGQQGDLDQIVETLPRRTSLTRQAAGERAEPQLVASNVDTVFVVSSMNQDFNVRRLERYLSVIHDGGAEAVIVLNKADLADPAARVRFETDAAAIDRNIPVVSTSAILPGYIEPLGRWLGLGRTIGLVGSSGVGKSSLVNALIGTQALATGEIRAHDARGRHTTTHRELLLLPGDQGVLIDTPGMRELQLWTGDSLDAVFPDIAALLDGRCQYRDCRHSGEPGCAITVAISEGQLEQQRWDSYQKLLTESKAQAERKARREARLARTPRYRSRKKKR